MATTELLKKYFKINYRQVLFIGDSLIQLGKKPVVLLTTSTYTVEQIFPLYGTRVRRVRFSDNTEGYLISKQDIVTIFSPTNLHPLLEELYPDRLFQLKDNTILEYDLRVA